jgi:chromosome segregation ATPase
MWTGRQTLGSIEGAIANLRGEESQLDGALRSAVAEAERLRKERTDVLRELARIKLDEMAAGRLVNNLDAGERRALQILDDYRLRIAAAAERREALLKEVSSAEAERHAAAAVLEQALEALEALRAQAEAQVQTTPEWIAAKAKVDAGETVAAEAEKKAATSEDELGAKRKPYDDDPLFAYLWRRRFGTSEYKAGNFARMIDRIVADFIGFADVRPNYAALVEIPLRLREHATTKRGDAAAVQTALAAIERKAMLAAGVDAREQALAEARRKLAADDDALENRHALLKKIEEERTALLSGGTDPAYNEALTTIASADGSDDLATLYREARRTPTSADEAIVRRLEAIDTSLQKADADTAGLRRTAQDLARRRTEVEQVRDRFRTAGYDHPNTTFGNESDIADALKSILGGAVRSGVLWDLLRRGYSSRPRRGRPTFGAPSFPFPFPMPGGGTIGSAGGGWREPSSGGGWSPLPGPGGGGGSDDDDRFTTGGSF